ncbi:MAG TPA: ATP-binding protein [Terriglobales bacterium]|nr:ATP-binding protein [Terriglobales bacterium]
MTLPLLHERPIVSQPEFVIATRDTGYRSLAAAVAELLDNAVQASASEMHILVRGLGEHTGVERPIIAVWDNGIGMDPDSLAKSVQFGGTERFNDRTGLGRFGMGLPNSSVSIARRVDVFSWQRRGEVWHTYLDIDEVAGRQRMTVPMPLPESLPEWLDTPNSASGTFVLWSRCDRLELRRPSAICNRLRRPLSRIYREHIWAGLRIRLNGQVLKAFDPMFCRSDTGEGGAVPYGGPLVYELLSPRSGGTASVRVRFTELPVADWHSMSNEEKRATGVTGGAGVSFMRAGREIDSGWCLMGGKRKENYDDWWRCEVSFSPELDEYFGVTHSKQSVTPTAALRAILEPDLESVARQLNARVRSAFAALLAPVQSRAAVQATQQDRLLPAPKRHRQAAQFGLTYEVRTRPIAGREFLRVTKERERLTITLNEDHPFYRVLYRPLTESSDVGRFAVESLLLAAARAGLDTRDSQDCRYIEHWSDALAAFLDAGGRK